MANCHGHFALQAIAFANITCYKMQATGYLLELLLNASILVDIIWVLELHIKYDTQNFH